MGLPPAVAKKIAEAKTTKKGDNIKAGDYLLLIKRIICEDKYSGTTFIPEFEIVEAEKTEKDADPNKVGSECSTPWLLDAAGDKGSAMRGNTKQFACALLGLPENAEMSEVMEKIGPYAGPSGDPDSLRARGMYIRCKTFRDTVKKGPNIGQVRDYPRFFTVPTEYNTPEQVAQRRSVLDQAGK